MLLSLRVCSQGGPPGGGDIPPEYTGDPRSELRAPWDRDRQARQPEAGGYRLLQELVKAAGEATGRWGEVTGTWYDTVRSKESHTALKGPALAMFAFQKD